MPTPASRSERSRGHQPLLQRRPLPDVDELAVAESVCWQCPVRRECADYAAQVPSWGLWGADRHSGKGKAQRAA